MNRIVCENQEAGLDVAMVATLLLMHKKIYLPPWRRVIKIINLLSS